MQIGFISLAALLGVSWGASFTYDRCDTTNGPSAWSGSCQSDSTTGTPINLCGSTKWENASSLVLSSSYATARAVNAHNPGYNVQINIIDNAPTLQAGTLATTVGYSTDTANQTWILEQLHWHWGRTGNVNEGSEHYLRGTQYPMEAHYVHYNSKYNSVADAAASGNTDALLVVGVFLEIGDTDSAMMTTVGGQSTEYTTTPSDYGYTVSMTDLFDGSGAYWAYPGGLTTPGCNLIVTWIVMRTPKTITEATLNLFKAVSTVPPGTTAPLIALYGNFRPLQSIGTRTLLYTSNPVACGDAPTEPTFDCTSSAILAKPAMLYHLAASLAVLFVFLH